MIFAFAGLFILFVFAMIQKDNKETAYLESVCVESDYRVRGNIGWSKVYYCPNSTIGLGSLNLEEKNNVKVPNMRE